MKKAGYIIFIAAICLICLAGTVKDARADQDVLLKILVKKGILTREEAEAINAEARMEEEKNKKEQKETLVKEIKEKGLAVPDVLKGLKFEMLGYADYSIGKSPEPGDNEKSYNRFSLTRGYLTVKKEMTPWLHARVTLDIHRDSDGDYKERLKYLYAELRPPDLGFFTNMKAEIGQGHIPWLDFEEHVNPYRCQGTMAIERAGVFNSADVGVSLRGYFGGELEDAKEKTGNHHYDGRFGSWHVGLYNGAGYHHGEDNNNKVLEGRLTMRPLPDLIPGLQLSYLGLYGEGNKKTTNNDYPDYLVNLLMLSYEHPMFIFTGQYIRTKGNAGGSWVDAAGDALDTAGYSFFADYRLPVVLFSRKRLHLFGRYDHFDEDDNDDIGNDTAYDMYIAGLACDVYKGNKFILDFETTDYGDDANTKHHVPIAGNNLGNGHKIQAVWQIKF